jgi:hypothetical protein
MVIVHDAVVLVYFIQRASLNEELWDSLLVYQRGLAHVF